MRMRFGVDEDEAFHECAGRLISGFADWLDENDVVAEPASAELLLQYKWLEGDGDLAAWPLEHVETFLDGWCPRVMAEYRLPVRLVPLSVATFVEYLDESGLLTPGSPRPSQVRRLCTAYADDYDELEARGVHPVLDEFGTPPDPVRIPGPADRATSAAAATVLVLHGGADADEDGEPAHRRRTAAGRAARHRRPRLPRVRPARPRRPAARPDLGAGDGGAGRGGAPGERQARRR
jgi:hypothetical protein